MATNVEQNKTYCMCILKYSSKLNCKDGVCVFRYEWNFIQRESKSFVRGTVRVCLVADFAETEKFRGRSNISHTPTFEF